MGYFFLDTSNVLFFTKKTVLGYYILGDFFTNSPVHPDIASKRNEAKCEKVTEKPETNIFFFFFFRFNDVSSMVTGLAEFSPFRWLSV
jgi:hypothetical protein